MTFSEFEDANYLFLLKYDIVIINCKIPVTLSHKHYLLTIISTIAHRLP